MKVSIGIPVYNGEAFLDKAIGSVLNQSYENFELILLNDGSTDTTLKIMQYYEKKDNRIKVVSDGLNKGIVQRLNEFVKMASGEYIVRMDADDIMFPERIKVQLERFLSNPKVDLVHSAAISINKSNEIIGIKQNNNLVKNPIGIIHPSVMALKSFFLENPYEEGFPQMEDRELWFRTHKKYEFSYIKDPLLFYREDGGKISIKHRKMLKGIKNFCRKYEIGIFNKFKLILMNRIKFFVYNILEKLEMEKLIYNTRFKELNELEKTKYKVILQKATDGVF